MASRLQDSPKLGRYTGPAYPFKYTVGGALGPKTDVEVIFTSMVNILTTARGTLPYAPKFGSEIPNLVFEPNDEITRSLIRYFVRKDLEEQDPRVNVIAVRTDVDETNAPYTVHITVTWAIVGDPTGRVFSGPVSFRLSATV
jgi:phage baseplate assembly protein W